jgi:peptidyl-prolyl isomerase E (cyclophilin E)
MASTSSKSLFVGGLAEDVTESLVRAAFIPFGDLSEVHVPLDHATQKNKGFAFVEFQDAEDAEAAIANMNGAEINGKPLRVNPSKSRGAKDKPVWHDACVEKRWLRYCIVPAR